MFDALRQDEGMGIVDSIERMLEQVDALITGRDKPRDFAAAYDVAVQITTQYHSEPRGWTKFVLLCNLTDQHREALDAQQEAREQCGDLWTPLHEGDCHREHALYCIRHGRVADGLEHLDVARARHRDDPNRLALLEMVEGRLWYSQGQYQTALPYFVRATRMWNELQRRIDAGEVLDPPDQQWRFNSDRWMLKTLVALYGANAAWPKELWSSLQERMPQNGSPDLEARLKLVMRLGRLGNRLDNIIESPRGQAFIQRHKRLERLARRFLTKR